ncbi:hypothetical protein [Vibrio cholerae]|uniref:hypothetical protein n=1 Tax=Vibrio cholerae TaxID=666 RepID=UPI0004D78933|nr:hypothetical protein [Vibrio cholerae]EGR2501380.1 hypothetical protein [Vibrio cholerae]KEH06105.1 hypothetical protein M234_01865 [Vibrio cholerae 2012EL-1759]MCD6657682.1 hypothetical protein [Vibrio cholerae]MVB43562.1 hypothetical protein [Vibrio cholerae]NOE70527.1 hypothetical protein [Vibrio cholerae]
MRFLQKLFGKKDYSLQNYEAIELLNVNDEVKKAILLCHGSFTLSLRMMSVSKLSDRGANESEALSYFLGALQGFMNYHQYKLNEECAKAYCVFLAADTKHGNVLFSTHNLLMQGALQDEDETIRLLSENILKANQNGWQEMSEYLNTGIPPTFPKLRSIFNIGY